MNIEDEMERVVHGGKTTAELREEEKKARMEELEDDAYSANHDFTQIANLDNEYYPYEKKLSEAITEMVKANVRLLLQNMADDGTLDKLLHEIGYQRASEHLCTMTPIN